MTARPPTPTSRYHAVYDSWTRDPEAFWKAAATDISWYKLWDKVFDPYAGQYGRWFVGAQWIQHMAQSPR